MNEFDFDELDRAVSSVLGVKNPATETADPIDASTEKPSVAPAQEESESIDKTTGPIASKRSKGRFMDIVPPSYEKKQAEVAKQPSREAALIQPPAATSAAPEAPVGAAKSIDGVAKPLARPESVAAAIEPEDTTEEVDPDTHLDNVMTELDNLDTADDDDSELLPISPFVTGASPDKRPLGSPGDAPVDEPADEPEPTAKEINHEMNQAIQDALSEPASGLDTGMVADKTTTEPELEAAPEAVLPEELRADIVAVEAAEIGGADTKKVEDEAASAASIGAIKPQYATKPGRAATEQPAAAVFDTTDYEAAKPVKKESSGWVSVLIITGLVLLGAGAGAAAYYFNLFGLL